MPLPSEGLAFRNVETRIGQDSAVSSKTPVKTPPSWCLDRPSWVKRETRHISPLRLETAGLDQGLSTRDNSISPCWHIPCCEQIKSCPSKIETTTSAKLICGRRNVAHCIGDCSKRGETK